jgi:hypothetical protein
MQYNKNEVAAKPGFWWAKTGKKLDMGKACVRFKKLDDLALDVIAEAISRAPAKAFIEYCEAATRRDRPSSMRKTATGDPGESPKVGKSRASARKSSRQTK